MLSRRTHHFLDQGSAVTHSWNPRQRRFRFGKVFAVAGRSVTFPIVWLKQGSAQPVLPKPKPARTVWDPRREDVSSQKSRIRGKGMNVLVLYFSKTGNTRKVADHVAEGVRSVAGVDAVVKSTAEVTKDDFVNAAGVIAGSPVYFGVMAADLKRIFDEFVGVRKQMENKVGAAFASSAFWAGGNETTIISIIQCLLIYGMIIVGDPMAATGHYGAASLTAPDEKAAETAQKLGARVAELCIKLSA